MDTPPSPSTDADKGELLPQKIATEEIQAGIHRLPIVIWQIIFELASYAYVGPITLSHICRFFRHIAFNTPLMWGTVDFDQPLSKLRYLIERSRGTPLFIRCFKLDTRLFHILDQLSIDFSRVQSLQISYTGGGWTRFRFLGLLPDNYYEMSGNAVNVPLIEILESFPNLRQLCADVARTPSITPNQKFMLQVLKIGEEIPVTDFYDGISSLPLLEELDAVIHLRDGTFQPPHTVSLQHLNKLKISFLVNEGRMINGTKILEKMEMPALHTVIMERQEDGSFPYSEIRRQNICQPEVLVIGWPCGIEYLVWYAENEPGRLHTLILLDNGGETWKYKHFLECIGNMKKRVLCPALHRLEMTIHTSQRKSDIHGASIPGLLLSRIQRGYGPKLLKWNGAFLKLTACMKVEKRAVEMDWEAWMEEMCIHELD